MQNTERLVFIDDLSGLYNRRYLYSHLPKELQAAQTQCYNLWLFMLDIDNFKMINDTYGHMYGDEIIKEISNIITENTKPEDKKVRYAGDEFTIILPNVEMKDVISVAERLLARVNAHTFKEKRTGKEINITMSLGIAGYPQDASDPTELINLADKSLYISKQKGKNCISTASEITPEIFWKRDILDRFPCSLFIEREPEINNLKDALDNTSKSGGRLFLITGELGIGKTRLLTEFENLIAGSAKASCLSVHCEEKFILQPYYAIGEILYKYFSGIERFPEGTLAGLSETMLAELFNFMPLLKNIPGVIIPDIKDLQKKVESLVNGLVKLLQNISQIKPLCLFFDDFHFVDKQSMEVILNITQKKQGYPILVLAAFSHQELSMPDPGPLPLAHIIKTEILQDSSQTLALAGLTQEGIKKLIANIFEGIPLSGKLLDLIYKITKGNPLFAEELLKYLIEKELIVYRHGKWQEGLIEEGQLPLSIEDTIRKRIAALSAETKEMISKAAVIGDHFQVDLLQKIDSEDRGYILDLIEAAKKIGLIYEKQATGRDEFSFVTGEIRKVLLNLLDDDQTKHFHSRLGQIKEKLYPDKISSIAGELYYNFKKAEDWVRAEQYAKVIKEGRATFYDRAMQYAESLLEEIEEERLALPLSKKTLTAIPELIRYTYLASINSLLYPAQSKIRLQPVEEMNKRLSEIFSEADILMLAYFEEDLIVNNKRVSRDLKIAFLDRFISLLKNSNIESIVFTKGVRQEELFKFIDIINTPENQEEGLSAAVEKSGLFNIKINEMSYGTRKAKSKEKESLQEIMLIDYILGRLPSAEKPGGGLSSHTEEITLALDKLAQQASKESGKDKESVKTELMVKSIQKIGNQFLKEGSDKWPKYKEDLAKTVLSLEPNLRANILGNQQEDNKEVDVIGELSIDIPEDIILDVLCRQYQQGNTGLDKIRNLAHKFLSLPGKKEKITPLLKEKLGQLGASNEESNWILGEDTWEKLSWKEKVDKILSLPAKNLFKLLPVINVDSLIRELLSQQQEAPVEVIIERIFALLVERYPDSRPLTGYFSKILDILVQISPQKLLPKFIKRLSQACLELDKDQGELFFSILSPHFDKTINTLLTDGRMDLIKDIIQCYEKNANILERAQGAFELLISDLIKELTRRIDYNLDWQDVADILVLFKDKAAKPLLEETLFEKGVESGKYFEAYLRRFNIAKIIKRLPKEGLLPLLKERCSDSREYIIKNLIELIVATEDDEIIEILKIPLKHKDEIIRKKAIFMLGRLKGKASVGLLGEALEDENPSLRKFALNILKGRKDDFALQAVSEYRKNGNLPEDIRRALS